LCNRDSGKVKVPTANLLAQVAEAEGFKVIGCDLWRERR